MKANEKIYDKCGRLINIHDVITDDITDEYSNYTLEEYDKELYIAGMNDCWKIEAFTISCYKDGFILDDFEKVI